MAVLRTAHHGAHVSTIEGVATALRGAGFTNAVVGGRTEFRPYEDHPLRDVCRKCGPSYGGEFDSYILENPVSKQQLFLLEVKPDWLVAAPGSQPAQTDLTIVLPVDGDPEEVSARMRALSPSLPFTEAEAPQELNGTSVTIDGQRFILTRDDEPFAIVHYRTADFPKARAFYEQTLGIRLEELPRGDASARYRLANLDARLELEVRDDTPVLDPSTGKRYRGGGYFRITNVDLEAIAARNLPAPDRLEVATGRTEWFFLPDNGAGYVYGPLGEMIELFDDAVDYKASPPFCPEVEEIP